MVRPANDITGNRIILSTTNFLYPSILKYINWERKRNKMKM